MSLSFGTDGVRGVANAELTPELALALGRAAARVLGGSRFVIGRDTRRSGMLIEAALSAGLASEGCHVERLGILPTPAVAWLSATEDVPGVMISASHNSFGDNGVKFFAPGGRKLSDDLEARFESELATIQSGDGSGSGSGGQRVKQVPTGADVGDIVERTDVANRYGESVAASLGNRGLDDLFIVLDCANGAASEVAPAIFRGLGATVEVLAANPDGCNINETCGSTHPENLQRAVVSLHADLGLALDGDADRVVAVDHRGELVDGDQLIAISALDMASRGLLRDNTVVVTVMTNLGFRLAMIERGLEVIETQVGDRYVLEALEAGGFSLGGEQSGHLIFSDLATTGDGVLSGVQVLDAVCRTGRSLAELADEAMTRLPQVLRNVSVANSHSGLVDKLRDEIGAIEADLNMNGERGRVLVRPSGTEPVVRVMAEASTMARAQDAVQRLIEAVQRVCD
ncbi:MAG: phosphoglucosamine mutase [Acidimicrobiales bacterium]